MEIKYKDWYELVGLNVSYYRRRRKYSQLEFAELVGIERSHVSKIELGTIGVSLDVIFKICEALKIQPEKLFDFRE